MCDPVSPAGVATHQHPSKRTSPLAAGRESDPHAPAGMRLGRDSFIFNGGAPMNRLRPDLPPLPSRIAGLPIDPERGYPVPWFVAWHDGKPEFRTADGRKFRQAIRDRLCWVCGQPLGRHLVFVIGPMCTVNRVTVEPPCHLDCAEFSVRACPFLSKPQMTRRENDLP